MATALPATKPVLEEPPPCLEGVQYQSAEEIFRLPLLPQDRLPNRELFQPYVRWPLAPSAKSSTPDHEVLTYTHNLWQDLTASLWGEGDQRIRGIANAKKRSKYATGIIAWWHACAEKEVTPAAWIYWDLRRWRIRYPDRKPQFSATLRAPRVLDGQVRRFFRIEGPRLGGDLIFDPAGKLYLEKLTILKRKIRFLFAQTGGCVTDAAIEGVFLSVFPKGLDNLESIRLQIHNRAKAHTARLADESKAGRFVWEVPGSNSKAEAMIL